MKIASGATHNTPTWAGYDWTEAMMREAAGQIDGTGIHFYTFTFTGPAGPATLGPATDFDGATWAHTLSNTLQMDEYISGHATIMDRYDPDKRKVIAVDEWGVAPIHSGQSRRLPAAAEHDARRDGRCAQHQHLHAPRRSRAYGEHCADGERPSGDDPDGRAEDGADPDLPRIRDVRAVSGCDLPSSQSEIESVQQRSVVDTSGECNGGARRRWKGLRCRGQRRSEPIRFGDGPTGMAPTSVSGRVLTATSMQAHNTFANPEVVKPVDFHGARISGSTLSATLPAKSVVLLQLQ